MLDTFYQWLVVLLPFVFAVGIELCSKNFRETRRYRVAVLISGIVFSAITYVEMEHERRKSVAEQVAAIQDTSERVATKTSAGVSAVLGAQFAETVAAVHQQTGEVRNMGKQLKLLWEHTDTGEQKRQTLIDGISKRTKWANTIFDICRSAGPPGSGGSHPEECTNMISLWTTEVRGYISESLGQTYVNRFEQAGNPTHLASAPRLGLDPRSAPLIELQVREVESRVDALKEFVKELANNSVKVF